MIKLQQYTFVCAPQPVQWAGIAALDVDMQPHIDDYRRKRDLILIEDDIYAGYAGASLGQAPAPLAAYCPERVFYISGAAKALSPGLRLGFLVSPDASVTADQIEAMAAILRPADAEPEGRP